MIDQLISQIENLSPILWASQICGFIAFTLYAISNQLSKKKFLIMSLFFFVFFGLEQGLAKLYVGIYGNIISIIRSIILLIELKHNKEKMPNWINITLIALAWIVTIVYYCLSDFSIISTINAFFPAILSTIYSITINNKNYMIVKTGLLINELGYFIYFLVNKLPLSYIREFILLLAIIIGMIKEKKKIGN